MNALRDLRERDLLGVRGFCSPSFFPCAAEESGNMLNAVLSSTCVSFGAIAWQTAPKTPSRVAIRTGRCTIASTTSPAASSGESVGTFS